MAIEMRVDCVSPGRKTATVRHFVVEVGDVCVMPEVVSQKIEDDTTLVGVADGYVAGRLDSQVDIGVEFVGPSRFDDQVAGRRHRVGIRNGRV